MMRGVGDDAVDRPFGLRVLGARTESGRQLRYRVQALLTLAIVSSHVVGAVVVIVLSLWVIPGSNLLDVDERVFVVVVVPVYVIAAVVACAVWGTRRELPRLRWAADDRRPTPVQQRAALRAPLRLLVVQVVPWFGATLLFGALAASGGARLVVRTSLTVALGGVVSCTFAYLLSELALRPVAARALVTPLPDGMRTGGLTMRALLGWIIGTGTPLFGLLMVAVFALVEKDVAASSLAVSILGLGGLALLVGLLLLSLGNRRLVDPLRAMRRALERVEQNDLSTQIVVYDGSEIGQVQSAFNRMVTGLQERARLQDLFSRHVGDAVAQAALDQDASFDGVQCDATALFVDLVGSTALTERLSPHEVVGILNHFFERVVAAVDHEGGWVNKFEGDAALCVFGPPTGLEDHASAGLRAARQLQSELQALVQDLGIEACIGVASGAVVAANIGSQQRYEYTIIGDPVNTAARLTEIAKGTVKRVLVADSTLARVDSREAARWSHHDTTVLRGRTTPTASYTL